MEKIVRRLLPTLDVEPMHTGKTRSNVATIIHKELNGAQYISGDLPDQMFGHLVSTELARDILNHFITSGYVKVAKKKRASNLPGSDDVERALDQAFQDAKENGLCYLNPQESTTTQGKTERTAYSWQWQQFPSQPIQEDQLVEFLNLVIERAFHFARSASRIVAPNDRLRHRFAAPLDKTHALPLSSGEDLRPDFLLLPVEAFQADSKTVDDQYVNFTAVRAVGESRNNDLSCGVDKVLPYLRGMRRSQPWLQFAIAIVMTKNDFCLIRGDSSGMEGIPLSRSEGRGCIEFVRILLGLALAEPVDLGQNPDVELDSKVQTLVSASASPGTRVANRVRSLAISRSPSPIHSTSAIHSTCLTGATTSPQSAKSKRKRPDADNDVDARQRRSKKMKVHVDRRVFFPTRLYEHAYLGILYNASSIRGRCTVVLCVAEPASLDRLALKMLWQDAACLVDQENVLGKLSQYRGHPNVIVQRKHFRALRKGRYCSTLEAIRGLLEDHIAGFGVENRFLIVSLSDLKRPVKYFWGLHDFVRGLRGALLGHQYLVSIGILHRDFSENNMVLTLFPGDERGYLINFDMATLQEAAKPTQPRPPSPPAVTRFRSFSRIKRDETTPVKPLRIGSTPYMSINVLRGGRHTHFDDVESFLYVLLLFFFSYAGPLDKKDLLDAHTGGFVESVGSGQLPHRMSWPPAYAEWVEGDFDRIYVNKLVGLVCPNAGQTLVSSSEWKDCLKHWPSELRGAINTLLGNAMDLFSDSMVSPYGRRFIDHTEVSHDQFIALLDQWLEVYADIEKDFSNCPFPSAMNGSQSASGGE